jgi:ABC-type sugar transport system ATPase subunit
MNTTDVVEPSTGGPRGRLVDMVEIKKHFAGGTVLHGVDFGVQAGEVHALVGQNGAGKSTLMKILGGIYPDYEGETLIGGVPVRLDSPRRSMQLGIAVIHQEFSLVPSMTIAENILLGHEPAQRPVLRKQAIRQTAADRLREVGLKLPLDRAVGAVGVATQQLTEIAKALSRKAQVLVMDEPTARLSEQERLKLFDIVRGLAARGVGIVYISHFLEEIFEIANRVTVLRDGRVVAVRAVADLDVKAVTSLMAGGQAVEGTKRRAPRTRQDAKPALELIGLTHGPFFRDVSLQVGSGEILGVAGLVGSGRSRVARAIVGAAPGWTGEIRLAGRAIKPRSTGHALRLGIGLLPENRKTEGLVLTRSAGDNVSMMALQTSLTRIGVVRREQRRRMIADLFERLKITPPVPKLAARNFSGGNQQKIALAKVLGAGVKVLVLDQPTAGVDVVTKHQLHELIHELSGSGVGILLISDELDELLGLGSRIAVMRSGNLIETKSTEGITRGELLHDITVGRGQGVAADDALSGNPELIEEARA